MGTEYEWEMAMVYILLPLMERGDLIQVIQWVAGMVARVMYVQTCCHWQAPAGAGRRVRGRGASGVSAPPRARALSSPLSLTPPIARRDACPYIIFSNRISSAARVSNIYASLIL